VLALGGSPVLAHEETALHALSVIHEVVPSIAGVTFRVVQITQPALVARNSTRAPLVIMDAEGKPFLRMYRGRVESNARSELTYISRDPGGSHASPPSDIAMTGGPVWRLLDKGQTWSWFDPRIRFAGDVGSEWTIDAALGNRPIRITGRFENLEGHGHFDTRLDQLPSEINDLELRLVDGSVPALFVRNETDQTLRVIGRGGEPFLTIGPRGVFGNVRSPDYYLGGNQTIRPVPASADPTRPPRWKRLSSLPIWSWLEFRARIPPSSEQRAVLGPDRRTILSWTTPMIFGNDPIQVTGHVDWIPPVATEQEGDAPTSVWIAVALAVVVAGGAYLLRDRFKARV
jgi:hypothetical protein